MEPEKLFCRKNGNRSFSIPAAETLDARALVTKLLAHFVSIEFLGERLEASLQELDISIEEYHDALNHLINSPDWPLKHFSCSEQFILGLAICDILGQGLVINSGSSVTPALSALTGSASTMPCVKLAMYSASLRAGSDLLLGLKHGGSISVQAAR